ncbi:hypothetical protein T4D_16192 [Trichinella pseudospiralis]|uniref:Uncharacterized protein n=1 Tax=Trichinella pseudospiralis TaxID=6337 RepID=A0A0V1DPJ8_TRIPS|nr:hypothetical protein T4D_16192 [Trichinella pseudospiralis]
MSLEIPDSHEFNQSDVIMANNIKKNTNIRDLIELDYDNEHKNEPRNSRLS